VPIAGAAGPVDLSATIHNVGNVDAEAVLVTFLAGRDRSALRLVGATILDIPALGSGLARVTWNPPAGGDWFVRAEARGPGGRDGPIASATFARTIDSSPSATVAALGVPLAQLALAIGSLAAGVSLAWLLAARRLR